MARTYSAVEFGSSKIICGIMHPQNNGLSVPAMSCVRYSGIQGGKWNRYAEVPEIVEKAISQAEDKVRIQIGSTQVGVPGCFVRVLASEGGKYIKTGRVTSEDIVQIRQKLMPRVDDRWRLIEIKPLYFFDDYGDLYAGEPIGIRTGKVTACYSYFFARRSFLEDVEAVFRRLHIEIERFIPEPLAQSMYFLSRQERDASALLLDAGYHQMDVSVAYGDGILVHSTLEGGGSMITQELQNALNIDVSLAENLKRGHIFGLGVARGAKAFAKGQDGRMRSFDAALVGNIIEDVTDMLCRSLKQKLDKYSKYADYNTPIYMIGGGLAMNGISAFLSARLGRKLIVRRNEEQKMFPPIYDTSLALLDNVRSSGYHLDKNSGSGSILKGVKTLFGIKNSRDTQKGRTRNRNREV